MVDPLVSVLVPTFNRAHFLGDAIASVLGQTHRDFEVVVVDDGSTDSTPALLSAIADPRLRVVRHERNRGIPAARNTALAEARGRYVAWLDSDDIARPTRLAEQVAFLEKNPTIAMVGTCAGKLRSDGTRKGGIRVPPFTPELIAAWLLFRSAFQQSSLMGRASVLTKYAYDPDFPVCEDVDMFLRLQKEHRLANLPRVLIDRRLHPAQSVRERRGEIAEREMAIARPMLARFGMDVTDEDVRRHVMLGRATLDDERIPRDFLAWGKAWLGRLQVANRQAGIVEDGSLALACDYFWTLACRASAPQIGAIAASAAFVGRYPKSLVMPAASHWVRQAAPLLLAR